MTSRPPVVSHLRQTEHVGNDRQVRTGSASATTTRRLRASNCQLPSPQLDPQCQSDSHPLDSCSRTDYLPLYRQRLLTSSIEEKSEEEPSQMRQNPQTHPRKQNQSTIRSGRTQMALGTSSRSASKLRMEKTGRSTRRLLKMHTKDIASRKISRMNPVQLPLLRTRTLHVQA